jgi:hypothetical protein
MSEGKYAFLKLVGRYLGIALLVQLAVDVIILLLGWRQGWTSLSEYSNALQLGGMFVVGIGLLGIRGNWESTRSFGYQYSMSTTKQSSTQRIQHNLMDFAQSYAFLITMLLSGGISLLFGWILERTI